MFDSEYKLGFNHRVLGLGPDTGGVISPADYLDGYADASMEIDSNNPWQAIRAERLGLHPVGILRPYKDGWIVIGMCCVHPNYRWKGTPVYKVNIGPLYSQHCFICEEELVKGTSGVELFGYTEVKDKIIGLSSLDLPI